MVVTCGLIVPALLLAGATFLTDMHWPHLLVGQGRILHAVVSIGGLYLIGLVAIRGLIIRRRRLAWRDIGYRAAPPEWYVIGLVGLILWWAADYYLYRAFGLWDQTMSFERATLMPEAPYIIPGILLFLSVGPIAAILEETLFRGLLYQWMRQRLSAWPAILISALVFSLVHFYFLVPGAFNGLLMSLEIFMMGIALAYLFEKSHSLGPSIVLHAVNNLGVMAHLATS